MSTSQRISTAARRGSVTRNAIVLTAGCLFVAAPSVALASPPATTDYFRLRIVDDQSRRGVPLAEVKTVDNSKYVTDSAGLVAFFEPGQMDRDVYFYVSSHGYEMPADGFGFRGKSLKTTPGGEAEISIKRLNIAERMYRVTGAGIYRDTVVAGGTAPIAEPLLNAQVTGSDSVQSVICQGKLHWFWGDTNRPKYPLGNFHVPGATSLLPGEGGLDPAVGVDLKYLVNDEGFARPTCEMAGEGPTWIDGLAVVPTADGGEQMFAAYAKVRKFLEVYRRGIARWDDEAQKFVHAADMPLEPVAMPHGHALRHKEADGTEYVCFGNPFPLTRVKATPAAIIDLGQYENFTCLRAGVRLTDKERQRGAVTAAQLDRDGSGKLLYAWKRDTSLVDQKLEDRLRRDRKLGTDEGLFNLRDRVTNKPVVAHACSIAWNAWRKRFVAIFSQSAGTPSNLGEVWYAEAEQAAGPWTTAHRVVTHNKYSFYNPLLHPYFNQDGGRLIYFEGTYSTFFSGVEEGTPRYDYNQIMYRLDLADPRLGLK